MRIINSDIIEKKVYEMCAKANFSLPNDTLNAIKKNIEFENNVGAKKILEQLLLNAKIAETEQIPLCQDTGVAVLFLEIGKDVYIEGDLVEESINRAIAKGYKDFYLRKSMVVDPVYNRKNTNDNTPAIIHINFVKGDKIKIYFAPKGGGAENMSRIKMLKPSDGIEGVKKFIFSVIKKSGGNPCPPIVVGVGIGGNFEKSAILAKKALFRDFNIRHNDLCWANFEREMLMEINKLNIGAQGFGGSVTALNLAVETFPCHIASLPVAVNIQCHSHRHLIVEI